MPISEQSEQGVAYRYASIRNVQILNTWVVRRVNLKTLCDL